MWYPIFLKPEKKYEGKKKTIHCSTAAHVYGNSHYLSETGYTHTHTHAYMYTTRENTRTRKIFEKRERGRKNKKGGARHTCKPN